MKQADETRIESAELWIYLGCYESVGLNTEHTKLPSRQLLGFVVRRKLSFFGHAIRDGGCELVKCVIQDNVMWFLVLGDLTPNSLLFWG